MLKEMTLKTKGLMPVVKYMTFRMLDGTIKTIKFDKSITHQTGDIIETKLLVNTPVDFKPWKIADFETHIGGISSFVDVTFLTDRFFVAFTDETLEKLNRKLSR